MSQSFSPVSYENLKKAYTDNVGTGIDDSRLSSVMKRHSHNKLFSETTFRSCLNNLRERGFVRTMRNDPNNRRRISYRIADDSPLPVLLNRNDLRFFTQSYDDLYGKSELEQPLKNLYRKIIDISGELDAEDPGEHLLAHGRRNEPDPKLTGKLYELLSFPYRKYNLNITYTTRTGDQVCVNIAVALIFYGIEQNMVYVVGENDDGDCISIRLADITVISVNNAQENTIFQSEKYKNLFNQMWSASLDDPVPVRVLFEDIPYVREKVERLTGQRKFARMKDTENGIEYTDTISGLSSFSRFLRSFGSSAIVLEPEELRQTMIESAARIAGNYNGTKENNSKGTKNE